MTRPFSGRLLAGVIALLALGACGRLDEVGRAPDFHSPVNGNEVYAMNTATLPTDRTEPIGRIEASLWRAGRQSLLGDRRARARGDILTVVIEIDDSASISNATDRARSGSETMALPQFLGLPQAIDRRLP